jgi:hypothetical protein
MPKLERDESLEMLQQMVGKKLVNVAKFWQRDDAYYRLTFEGDLAFTWHASLAYSEPPKQAQALPVLEKILKGEL